VELSLRTRVRAGDMEAFGLLFEEHAGAVYNHAFRLTGNWSTAEEVVSLTFLEAWRARGTIRAEGGSRNQQPDGRFGGFVPYTFVTVSPRRTRCPG
jgi:DNA-directed RNA polymerase specialized sigma24 family protein